MDPTSFMSSRRFATSKTVLLLVIMICVSTVFVGLASAQPDVSNKTLENTDSHIVERLVHFDSGGISDISNENRNFTSTIKEKTTQSQQSLVEYTNKKPGITVERQFWIANVALVTVDTQKVDVSSIHSIQNVDEVTTNPKVQATNVTQIESSSGAPQTDATEPANAEQEFTYGIEQISAPDVWNKYDTQGDNVRVAVLDTGVISQHPDITLTNTKSWAEWNTQGEQIDTEPQDYSPVGHGTHVSGTVSGGNASGTHIGVAPKAELMHGAVLTQCRDRCFGYGSQILSGMEWAVNNDADVLSMSLGGEGYIDSYRQAINNAEQSGTIVIAASGNRGPNTSDSPANVYDAVAVGATDRDKSVAGFSSGERIVTENAWRNPPAEWPNEYVVPDVVAPGVQVQSAAPDGTYQSLSGTSMATPHVAGTAVLMESATQRDLTPDEIKGGLTESTEDINHPRVRSGDGLISADGAVAAVADQPERDVGYYTNDNGRVGTNQLFRAVADWRDDQITDMLIQEVISYWRSGEKFN